MVLEQPDECKEKINQVHTSYSPKNLFKKDYKPIQKG